MFFYVLLNVVIAVIGIVAVLYLYSASLPGGRAMPASSSKPVAANRLN